MSETLINPEIVLLFQSIGEKNGKTLTNPIVKALIDKARPHTGTVFEGGYRVIKPLSVRGGEADLYLTEQKGTYYVVKLYRRENAVKADVIEKLSAIDSPHIAKTVARHTYNGFPFEVLPYYQKGSLEGKRFDFDTIKTVILPQLNEALHVLHQNGILHKDLKPANLMLEEDGTIVIIDFGISSAIDGDYTVKVTETGLTLDYSAPEVFRKLYLVESDYYALGITLYELFTGHTPYHHLSEDAIMQYLSLQRIPFPDDMPGELKELILALTYHDLTARHDTANPNRRWTYDEVAAWLRGEKQILPGHGRGGLLADEIPPYSFRKQTFSTLPSLVQALGEHWNDGKNELFYSRLSSYFDTVNPVLARRCRAIENEAKNRTHSDDYLFWKLLQQLYPDLKKIYWRGHTFESLPALGRDMLNKLSAKKPDRDLWDSILAECLLSSYLERLVTPQPELYQAISAIEDSYRIAKDARSRDLRYYLMAFYLSGQTQLTVDNQTFFTLEELAEGVRRRADESLDTLKKFCNRLIGTDLSLTPQLEAWLTVLGHQRTVASWLVAFRGASETPQNPEDAAGQAPQAGNTPPAASPPTE
ncbi:MAG: serine/threonine protein kinase [Clostridia bacterium]|nr:serine/threonine protein kinase [Clostridia bacterium]